MDEEQRKKLLEFMLEMINSQARIVVMSTAHGIGRFGPFSEASSEVIQAVFIQALDTYGDDLQRGNGMRDAIDRERGNLPNTSVVSL